MITVGVGFWILFHLFVAAMLALDLGVFQRKAHVVKRRESLFWTIVWIVCAFAFASGVFRAWGSEKGLEFLTGYVIEKSLSVDNLFVFLVIFQSFAVPPKLQRVVLLWGVIGALVLRAIFILAGAALLRKFHWLMYLLGLFLIVTAAKLLFKEEDEQIDPGHHWVVKMVRKIVPVTSRYEESKFFVLASGRLYATPLLVVLAVVECTDLMFAMDSIPAIFAITTDTFIVYTSNVFAILGLRALYFLLAGAMSHFRFMKEGLAAVLGFVGIKMLIEDILQVPTWLSLGFIAAALTTAAIASVKHPLPVLEDTDEPVSPGPGNSDN